MSNFRKFVISLAIASLTAFAGSAFLQSGSSNDVITGPLVWPVDPDVG